MNLRNGFTLGSWTVYPLEGRLVGAGQESRVQPKSMDVLLCLAEASGAVVEREELLRQIWGERAVSDEPLTRCIGELRRALGDTRNEPEYILTVPKRGYRLLQQTVAMTEDEESVDGSDQPRLTAAQKALRYITFKKLAAGFGVLVLAALVQTVIERLLDNRLTGDDSQLSVSETEPRSIAVLPFVDMTAAQDQAYFGDGLAEELINLLVRNPALRVAARTSSFSFRNSSLPAQEIAQQLHVKHVVEGSVRRDGDRVRITAQLVSADRGYHVWSETFNESFGDIFSIQDRISKQIAATLEVSVLGDRAESTRTDPQVYDLFLKAKHSAREGSRESLEQAVAYLEEALAIDTNYAPGWAELSNVYCNLAGQGHWDWDDGFAAGREAANRAVSLNPEYSGGYRQLAWIAHRYDGDLPVAMQHMQKALDIESASVSLLRYAAVLLLQFGRVGKAIDVLEYCAVRSPTDPRGFYNLGVAYKYGDKLEDAERSFRNVLELSSVYNGAKSQLGEVLFLLGRPQEAMQYWGELEGHRLVKGRALVGYAMQQQEESDAALAELIAGWGEEWPTTVVEVYAYRGQLDEAFAWLEKDYEKFGAAGWGELKLQRLLDNMKGGPRWIALLERTGVTDEQLSKYDLNIDLP